MSYSFGALSKLNLAMPTVIIYLSNFYWLPVTEIPQVTPVACFRLRLM